MTPATIELLVRALQLNPDIGPLLKPELQAGVVPHFQHSERRSLVVGMTVKQMPTAAQATHLVGTAVSTLRQSCRLAGLFGMEIVLAAEQDGRTTRLLRYGQTVDADLAIDARLQEPRTESSMLTVYLALRPDAKQ